MQYILSEEEMEEIRQLRKDSRRLPSIAVLQKECTRLADTLDTFRGWDGEQGPEPWGCIITADYEHYCDECPVQRLCPREHKAWSK